MLKFLLPFQKDTPQVALSKYLEELKKEVWRAAIYGEDGEVRDVFARLHHRCDSPGDLEAGESPPAPTKFEELIGEVVNREFFFWYRSPSERQWSIEVQTEKATTKLGNLCHILSEKENEAIRKYSEDWKSGAGMHSILSIAIIRNQKDNVSYLLETSKIDLHTLWGSTEETVLHYAVRLRYWDLAKMILQSSSMPPILYINTGNWKQDTALHELVYCCISKPKFDPDWTFDNSDEHTIFELLLGCGANVDAISFVYKTPLHRLVSSYVDARDKSLLQCLLDAGAEVNTKDYEGNTPLHSACEMQDKETILKLLDFGADMNCQNNDWKTPREVFESVPTHDREFADRRLSRLQRSIPRYKKDIALVKRSGPMSKEKSRACKNFPIYLSYRGSQLLPDVADCRSMSWTAKDMKVSDVLYAPESAHSPSFLDRIETRFVEDVWNELSIERTRKDQQAIPSQPMDETRRNETQNITQQNESGSLEKVCIAKEQLQKTIAEHCYRWMNFPANNMSWIKDFIFQNTGAENHEQTLQFFIDSIQVRESSNLGPLLRIPHAKVEEGMVSVVIPFLDFETLGSMSIARRKIQKLEQAYFPFTGVDGLQVPQKLDETSNKTGRLKTLGTKENQVIYRWSQRSWLATMKQEPERYIYDRKQHFADLLTKFLSKLWPRMEEKYRLAAGQKMAQRREKSQGIQTGLPVQTRHGNNIPNASRMQNIRKSTDFKWLVVRQLWLYKLDDSMYSSTSYCHTLKFLNYYLLIETILTAIPLREGSNGADDLLETIRQKNSDEIETADELMKRIIMEAVNFPKESRWAGLGQHILDIFQGEITLEANEELRFFSDFTNTDWKPENVYKAIQEAAKSTWQLKDIRDELGLIRQVFETQKKVTKEFVNILNENACMHGDDLDELLFVEEMIKRTWDMDKEASSILEGLSSITQAMQAQASLKEAETARLMNLIILPFTVVTVVFTPLSFMTSLFAVNSDGFPHNEDGELRLPWSWLTWRLFVGEAGTLIPLFILIASIYYYQGGKRYGKQQKKLSFIEKIMADRRI
ncbi:hypothetical protein DER45DRAFT_580044 [Fusarium avenaceum]|nr:hypothetical protein DER45DRAFT_580044 [Fusarium avenaceum]